jgi:TPP-dependent pyruvate/acetoin dehydrogenase alpha subunit
LISREKTISLYAAMVRCRKIAGQVRSFAPEGVATPEASGWEAAMAGVTAELIAGDCVRAQQNSGIQAILREVQGEREKVDSAGEEAFSANERETATSQAPDQFDEAFLAASGFKAAKCGKIAVFFGEGLRLESWSRRLQQAARRNLPLLIVSRCAMQGSHPAAPSGTSARKDALEALAFGVPAIAVDANDAMAIYRVASESVGRARQRRGPTLIECVAFPQANAAAPASCDRPQASGPDPIVAMEAYLLRKGFLNAAARQGLESELRGEIASANWMAAQ